MGLLLRITAAVCLVWAVILLGLPSLLFPAAQWTTLSRGVAIACGIANVVLAWRLWTAAKDPRAHRGLIAVTIALLVLKTAADLYGLLVFLPPRVALGGVADLVVSVGLLVGVLEALPRTFAPTAATAPRRIPDQTGR